MSDFDLIDKHMDEFKQALRNDAAKYLGCGFKPEDDMTIPLAHCLMDADKRAAALMEYIEQLEAEVRLLRSIKNKLYEFFDLYTLKRGVTNDAA